MSFNQNNIRFSIDAKNIRCDSQLGVCSKTLTITLNSEKLVLVKGKSPSSLPPIFVAKKFAISSQHFDTILHSKELGITVVTNGLNAAVYITKTHGSVSGMCGNADGERNNDVNVSKLNNFFDLLLY